MEVIIISKVIFKQWMYKPNLKSTAKAVGGMLKYIATREGVALDYIEFENESKNSYISTIKGDKIYRKQHGLFGKLHGMQSTSNIDDLSITRGYVENLADKKTTIYNAVISLKEEDAIEKDIIDKKDWSDLVQDHIYNIGKDMGIEPRNLEWVAAVHIEKGHPHVHIMYWDADQKMCKNFFDAQISNKIRKDITKEIYNEEIKEIQKEKDEKRKSIIDRIYKSEDSFLKNPMNVFANLSVNEIKELCAKKQNPYKIFNRYISDDNAKEILLDMIGIKENIEKTYQKGAIKYQYLPNELKKQVDCLTDKIIRQNPQIAREYSEYLRIVKEQASFFGGSYNINSYVKQAKFSIQKEVGNKILSCIKEIKSLEYQSIKYGRESIKGGREYDFKKQYLLNTMQYTFDVLVRENHYLNNGRSKDIHKELSISQKKELSKNSMDNSIEWDF